MTSITRWPAAFSVYAKADIYTPVMVMTSTTVYAGDDSDNHTVSYVGKSIDDIVTEFNANLVNFKVVKNLDIGAERILADTLTSDESQDLSLPDHPVVCRYVGIVTRAEERSVIQLKPPRAQSPLESWYPRIGRGRFRVRFSDTNFQNYPGINPNAIYEFGVNEFFRQEWSTQYGMPFKDVQGEIPDVVSYHPAVGATVLRVARGPIFYHNKNISVSIRGVPQANSIVKHVDTQNRLIYINHKVDGSTPITVDYSYRESDYVYDAVDLNASVAHNPLVVDTYVAFYLKPAKAEGAMFSGGDCIFHEIVTSEAAARTKVARIIPETLRSSTPQYEPVIYLGSLNVRQGTSYDDFDIIDTRTRGGGLYEEDRRTTPKRWRDAEFFLDVGNMNGLEVPGNAGIVVGVPQSLTGRMDRDEITERAFRDVAMGVVPIISFNQESELAGTWTDSLTFGDSELSVTLATGSTITLESISATGLGYSRDFYEEDMFRIRLESSAETRPLLPQHLYGVGYGIINKADYNSVFDVDPSDFATGVVKNFGSNISILYSGLTYSGVTYNDFRVRVQGYVTGGEVNWHIMTDPGTGAPFYIRAVEFPRFNASRTEEVYESFFFPYYGGYVMLNPHTTQTGMFQYTAPGVMFQQWASYGLSVPESGMFSWRTEDPYGHVKHFMKHTGANGIGTWSVAHAMNYNDWTALSERPWGTTMRLSSGTWYEAMDSYREWALTGMLANVPKLHETGHANYVMPSYSQDMAFMAHYQPAAGVLAPMGTGTGAFDDWDIVATDVNRLKTFLNSTDDYMVCRIDGWHANTFDNDWPSYDPVDTTFSGAVAEMQTGSTGIVVAPYSTFLFDKTQINTGVAGKYLDGTLIEAGGLATDACVYSIQLDQYKNLAISPWTGLSAKAGNSGFYMDIWAGVTVAGDYSNYLPWGKRGNLAEGSDAMVRVLTGLAWQHRTLKGDFPFIFSENIDERFVGKIPMMLQDESPGGTQGLTDTVGTMYQVPAWSTAFGDYSIMAETNPAMGTVANQAGSEAILKYQEWHLHLGKIPGCAVNFTGEGQSEIAIPVDTGAPVLTNWYPLNWEFAGQMVGQADQLAQYAFHGKRLKSPNEGAELTASATVGWPTGAYSLWNGTGNNIGLVHSWSNTGTGAVPIALTTTMYTGLQNKTGFYEITSGADTYISAFSYGGAFNYTPSAYTGAGVRVFEFR